MNYYIDFDSTLYDTTALVKEMIQSISDSLKGSYYNVSKQEIKKIFDTYIKNKQTIPNHTLIQKLDSILENGTQFVYDDTIPFLENLKRQGHRLSMLTYSKYSLQFQSSKINGSGLSDYFDALFITATRKYELDINYSNGIFLDDNPSDLLGLYSKKPIEVIRIRRNGNKYSIDDIDNTNIKEYADFNELLNSSLSIAQPMERID